MNTALPAPTRNATWCLLLLVLLTATGCLPWGRFTLAEVPPGDIPEEVRLLISARPDPILAWHACYQLGPHLVVATSHRFTMRGESTTAMWVTVFYNYFQRDQGKPQGTATAHIGYPSVHGVWSHSQTLSSFGGHGGQPRSHATVAGGLALVGGPYRVVGVTNRGRSFEAPIVNGFWALLITDDPSGAERFDRIAVYSQAGRRLHTY